MTATCPRRPIPIAIQIRRNEYVASIASCSSTTHFVVISGRGIILLAASAEFVSATVDSRKTRDSTYRVQRLERRSRGGELRHEDNCDIGDCVYIAVLDPIDYSQVPRIRCPPAAQCIGAADDNPHERCCGMKPTRTRGSKTRRRLRYEPACRNWRSRNHYEPF